MSIPKIIHYCWLSGEPFSDTFQKCLATWQALLPDYEFVLWDKSKFDIESKFWVKQACTLKKWAFAADYIRLYALYNYGGIYLDSDVQVLKSYNDLLEKPYFICRESGKPVIEAATMGAEKGCPWIKACLDLYDSESFRLEDLNKLEITLPYKMKKALAENGFQINFVDSVKNCSYQDKILDVLPSGYFSPKNHRLNTLNLKEYTYSIHLFDSGWYNSYQKEYFRIRHFYSKKYNQFIGFFAATLFALKHKLKELI